MADQGASGLVVLVAALVSDGVGFWRSGPNRVSTWRAIVLCLGAIWIRRLLLSSTCSSLSLRDAGVTVFSEVQLRWTSESSIVGPRDQLASSASVRDASEYARSLSRGAGLSRNMAVWHRTAKRDDFPFGGVRSTKSLDSALLRANVRSGSRSLPRSDIWRPWGAE